MFFPYALSRILFIFFLYIIVCFSYSPLFFLPPVFFQFNVIINTNEIW